MVTGNERPASKPGRTAENFEDLAAQLLAEARSVEQFLVHPKSHADWPAIMKAAVPEALRAPLLELQAAEDSLSEARLSGDDERIAEAWNRLRGARESANETELARARAGNAGADEWLRAHSDRLSKLRDDYAAEFQPLRLTLAGLAKLDDWRHESCNGSSACEVLLVVADKVIGGLKDPWVGEGFDDLDWDRLANCITGEIGKLQIQDPGQERPPPDGVEQWTSDRATLRWCGRKADVRGEQAVWLVNRAWEKRGRLISWTELLRAQYEWDNRLEPLREAVKGRAVDGSVTEADMGADVVDADHETLKRASRELRSKVNSQLGSEALTTDRGLMLADPEDIREPGVSIP